MLQTTTFVPSFSPELEKKIQGLKARAPKRQLGKITFDSPLLLAPMSGICNAPFRLLMQELGAGGTVSELISCHGINHANEKTLRMLYTHPQEKNMGLQIFGEDPEAMARAAHFVEDKAHGRRPDFIDINMGCPVRKVVTKGGGSALLRDPSKLGAFFNTIKKQITLPLSIKIRTGWDDSTRNAIEVVKIAREEGIEFVAIHGRTRTQAYRGNADWSFIENVTQEKILPIIGNGDLHSVETVKARLKSSPCQALMLGRGPLRNPFIFLEAFDERGEMPFTAKDYLEIILRFRQYLNQYTERDRTRLIQLKKHIVWFASGFKHAAAFRNKIFACPEIEGVLQLTQDYFLSLEAMNENQKELHSEEQFMAGGHG